MFQDPVLEAAAAVLAVFQVFGAAGAAAPVFQVFPAGASFDCHESWSG